MDIAMERSYSTPAANSTLLPMLIMSLARMKNAPKVADTFYESYDYIVVGSGPGGSTVASRLSEIPCVSVLLLEAGKTPPYVTDVPGFYGDFYQSDIDWGYPTVPQKYSAKSHKNLTISTHSGKVLGGSSILNGMQFQRGNKLDFDNWETKGWKYQEVFQYFIKMENNSNAEFLNNGYHGTGGPVTMERVLLQDVVHEPVTKSLETFGLRVIDSNGPNGQIGRVDLQETRQNAQRCSASKAYLVPTENRPNIDILTNAMVRKIVFDDRRAAGVLFDYKGNTYYVSADKEIIISAGTLKTPQLLMLSGIGPEEELKKFNIPVVADLPVGKNFHDHVASGLFFTINSTMENLAEESGNDKDINQYIEHRTGPLSSTTDDTVVAFLKTPLNSPFTDNTAPDVQLYFNGVPFGLAKLQLEDSVYEKVFQPYENSKHFQCLTVNIHPESRGSITLQSDDPYDMPAIDPNYFAEETDLQTMIQGMKACYQIVTNSPMQKLNPQLFKNTYPRCEQYANDNDMDKMFGCMAETFTISFLHFAGSARMGNLTNGNILTVVDEKLRVRNVTGLRVVDASVMPFVTRGNTMTPVYMIAEKAADMIKDTFYAKYYCQPDTPYQGPEGRLPDN